MIYKLTDDWGSIQEGELDDCLFVLFKWLDSDEAKETYSKDELLQIHNFFDNDEYILFKDNDKVTEYSGFKLEKVKR